MLSPRQSLALLALPLLVGCDADGLGFLARHPPPVPHVEPVAAFPPPPDSAVAKAETWYAACGAATFPMADLLPGMAAAMARQRIPYGRGTPDEWRDCSGSFLRLASYLGSACPPGAEHLPAPPGVAHYVAGERNAPQLPVKARSTRDLARWYLEQGRFVPVFYDESAGGADTGAADPGLPPGLAEARYLIKAGAVLWFSRGKPLAAKGVDQLLSRTAAARIHHVGVVVSVAHDDRGQVVGYEMFHGRNEGAPASVTEHGVAAAGGGPPFGNGGQYLVGIGSLLPPAPPPAGAGETEQVE